MKRSFSYESLTHTAAAKPYKDTSSDNGCSVSSREHPRILIVNSTLHTGGAEQIIFNLAKHLDRSRYQVIICYLRENGIVGEQILRSGVELVPLPNSAAGRHHRFTALKLRELVLSRNIDLIHTHDVRGFIDACACRLITPRLRHVHTFHFGNYPHREARIRRIEKFLWRIPDALVTVGYEQAAAVRDLYKIPESRLLTFWNGVDQPTPRRSQTVSKALQDCEEPVLASISTLTAQKGLEDLLSAAAELSAANIPFRLLIVGDGPLRRMLEQYCASLGLNERVRFVGWVPNAAERAIPVCDVFIQSSRWEAMSVSVLEAMACGKPVVVTRVGDNGHIVLDGQTGLTVPPRDPQALANALKTLLLDVSLRDRYGQAARRRHSQLFTTQHMVQRYASLYEELLYDRYRR